MDKRAAYRLLCEEEDGIPIFLQAWWLDATCGPTGWDVTLASKGGQIQAALPFRTGRRWGALVITQPMLTPFLGPWLRHIDGKNAKRHARQKELMTALIDDLPHYGHYQQSWSPDITNWLPFHWRGFRQTTRYTYMLNIIDDPDLLWRGMRENIRTDIRKAENRFELEVDEDGQLDEFLSLNALSFSRQGVKRGYGDDYVRSIDEACVSRHCRRIFIVRDGQGRAHAGAYIVWNAGTAHYLLGGGDPALRNSGATSLCIWKAIQFSSTISRRFDFEGSMIEPIERVFRAFGAEQTPYFQVSRTPSALLGASRALRFWMDRA